MRNNELFDLAFDALAKELDRELIDKQKMYKSTAIRERFVKCLAAKGIAAPGYRMEKLKRRLISQFGDQLTFYQPSAASKPQLVYSSSLSAGHALDAISLHSCDELGSYSNSVDNDGTENIVGSRDCDTHDVACTYTAERAHDIDTISQLYHSALFLRRELLSVKNSMPWPP